jgi:nitrogen regulatory protein P-II 2
MQLVIAYIRPDRLPAVKQALYSRGLYSMSVSHIEGCGRQKGFTESYMGVVMEVNLLKKVRIEMGISDDLAEAAMQTIAEAARTGKEGDGVIFALPVSRALRVRTGDSDI